MAAFRLNRLAAAVAVMVLACPTLCAAQTIRPPAEPRPQTVPEDASPGKSGSLQEPLGKKLNRTDGVLHPPKGIDPGVAIPPPQTGSSMPVIPPPGTPGGNPAIDPK
jgi:hypothetical protein